MKLKNLFTKLNLFFLIYTISYFQTYAQSTYWQQKVEYKMVIDMNVETHQFKGTQQLDYFNNSPDTLFRVFYHLYFNAFQPGSMMDIRSRSISDPDRRVGSRISSLKDNEIGYQKVLSLKQNGKSLNYHTAGTILEVTLADPILPGSKATFDMSFEAQVPVQIRRSGRDNKEGISYSMAQWYPKMAEYDHMGWHPNPYIAREFHGIWGNFDVKISIDPEYTIGGTGYLQNPNEIGHGYEAEGVKIKKQKKAITWHFKADNVMDFMWAADPDYTHTKIQVPNGPVLHFFYQKDEETEENWTQLEEYTLKAMQYINKHFGVYPYKQYSVIQGGDGGMEYPMATLITGKRSLRGLVGVTVHELLHSWFQHALGTNESLYAWMDEGYTSYASNKVMDHLFSQESPNRRNIHLGSYMSYQKLVESGLEEPSSLHSDHFNTNRAYSTSAYSKGAVFLHQLSYIIGQKTFEKGMLRYFDTWKFKHPTPNDFIRIMEKESGMVLDWYLNYWIHTTKTIDYSIKSVKDSNGKASVTLERIGEIPMPIDLAVTYKDGKKELYYIPLRIMRGEKENENSSIKRIIEKDWLWTAPTYTFEIPAGLSEIDNITIDPTMRMADINLKNNRVTPSESSGDSGSR